MNFHLIPVLFGSVVLFMIQSTTIKKINPDRCKKGDKGYRNRIRDMGYDTGSRIQNSWLRERGIRDIGYRIRGYRIGKTGYRQYRVGNRGWGMSIGNIG